MAVVVVARRGGDVFIGLSKKEAPAAAADPPPPEPVTLLVSMAVLQAAPQAGCVQGPIQPVFSAAAALMFIPRADVKLPSAEGGGWGVGWHCILSLLHFCASTERCSTEKSERDMFLI